MELFVADLLESERFLLWGLPPGDLQRSSARPEALDAASAVRVLYALYAARRGKTRYGDKTPNHVLYIPLFAGLFPEARFVHLIRDGRDVALSLIDLSSMGARPMSAPRRSAGGSSSSAGRVGRPSDRARDGTWSSATRIFCFSPKSSSCAACLRLHRTTLRDRACSVTTSISIRFARDLPCCLTPDHTNVSDLPLTDRAARLANADDTRGSGSLSIPSQATCSRSSATSAAAPMIVLLIMTRDQAELLRHNLAHHLKYGIDHVAVVDNGKRRPQRRRSCASSRITVTAAHARRRRRRSDSLPSSRHSTAPSVTTDQSIGRKISDTDEFWWAARHEHPHHTRAGSPRTSSA